MNNLEIGEELTPNYIDDIVKVAVGPYKPVA
jgi:hypothetical protein